MKSIKLLALSFLCAAWLQAATVTISQAVKGPDGQPVLVGDALIRISVACRSGTDYIMLRTISVHFTDGLFTKNLVATEDCPTKGSALGSPYSADTVYAIGDRATFSGQLFESKVAANHGNSLSDQTKWLLISPTYNVSFTPVGGQTWQETWAIPVSGSPLTIDQVRIQDTKASAIPIVGPTGPAGSGGGGGGGTGISGTSTWAQIKAGTAGTGSIIGTTTWLEIKGQ